MKPASNYSDLSLYTRILRYARPYWAHVAGFLLLSLVATPIALLLPLPLKLTVDSVLGDEPLPGPVAFLLGDGALSSGMGLLAFAVGLVVAVTLLSQVQKLLASLLHTYAGEMLALDFRARLFRHVQRLSLRYHDNNDTSDSAYRVLWDAAAIRHIVLDGVTPFITAGFTLLSMLFIIYILDPMLALIAMAIAPIVLLITYSFRDRLRAQWRDVKKLESRALSLVQEVLGAIRVVKAFGQEDREQERFVTQSSAGVRARIRASLAADGYGLLVTATMSVGTAAVLFVGVKHVLDGVLTLGSLLVVMAYLAELYGPLKQIAKNIGSLQAHLAGAERVVGLLDVQSDVVERPGAIPLVRADGYIRFEHVWFAYGKATVLRDVTFEIPAGACVGVWGKTGAGKTTLVSLLARFYDPSAGAVFLDDVDLRNYRLKDLADQFSIVLQEPVLFTTSIAGNIAYARPDASDNDIVAAAKAANAHEFISDLENGYDTQVGQRGVLLSGGERQRIALARAFLKDAPILILDEPTSSVDIGTESQIIEAMERLMRNRTTFVIAHRRRTLEHCDLFLKVDRGRVAAVSRDLPHGLPMQPAGVSVVEVELAGKVNG